MPDEDTLADTAQPRGKSQRSPIITVVFSRQPAFAHFRVERPVVIGRDGPVGALFADERLSRQHAEIGVSDGALWVRDLGSRNGTFCDGEPIESKHVLDARSVVRAGGTLILTSAPEGSIASEGGVVAGPTFGAALSRARAKKDTVLVLGETGTGKEVIARAFHEANTRLGAPFVALNCASIPEGLAERLLFGAKRGAYSGAMGDVLGHVQTAEGGTLFLDEIGELDLAVQAKLLRLLEAREVTPLGAQAPVKVAVRFCFATHRDLRKSVAEGKFREDLFYRLGENEVSIPPLRERREEIPHLAVSQLSPHGLQAHPRFIEACLLREWPGNVRELLRETRLACDAAVARGDTLVRDDDLRDLAGQTLRGEERSTSREVTREEVASALENASGNVSEAARALGLHRTQLRRTIAKLGLEREGVKAK